MLGRKRLYVVLPDTTSARSMLNELLLARIECKRICFWARDSSLPDDLPDASFWHKTDLTHGAELGMLTGGTIGLAVGVWLVAFPPDWVNLSFFALLVTTLVGIVLGGWMSGMAALAIPNSRLKMFQGEIANGKILMLVDVPFSRVTEIEAMIAGHHPEARFGGVEPHIPVFP